MKLKYLIALALAGAELSVAAPSQNDILFVKLARSYYYMRPQKFFTRATDPNHCNPTTKKVCCGTIYNPPKGGLGTGTVCSYFPPDEARKPEQDQPMCRDVFPDKKKAGCCQSCWFSAGQTGVCSGCVERPEREEEPEKDPEQKSVGAPGQARGKATQTTAKSYYFAPLARLFNQQPSKPSECKSHEKKTCCNTISPPYPGAPVSCVYYLPGEDQRLEHLRKPCKDLADGKYSQSGCCYNCVAPAWPPLRAGPCYECYAREEAGKLPEEPEKLTWDFL